MSFTIGDELERLLWSVAEEVFGPRATTPQAVASAALTLSDRYNAGRAPDPRQSDPQALVAQLLFFTPADLAKVTFPLAELAARGRLPRGPLRILDLGAGCGAQTLGLLTRLGEENPPREVRVDALDENAAALRLMARVLERGAAPALAGAKVDLRTHPQSVLRPLPAGASYDLILAGSLLAELPEAHHAPLARSWLDRLTDRGYLIILEPALRETARALHRLRAALVEGGAHLFAPCTHEGPCPALLDERDWCHEARAFHAPPRLAELSRLTGLRRHDLKWSYLTVGRARANVGDLRPDAERVVSAPLATKGKTEFFFCGAAGRRRVVRLDRHRGPDNAAFDQLDRGRLVWCAASRPGEALHRIERSTTVLAEDPAGGGDD